MANHSVRTIYELCMQWVFHGVGDRSNHVTECIAVFLHFVYDRISDAVVLKLVLACHRYSFIIGINAV